MMPKQRFLNACAGKPVDRPPVWIMRQAGRALPEYRAVRANHTFWDMITTPELAAEVTLQPVRRFPFDAAVIFSDILTVPYAMGQSLTFSPQPILQPVVASEEDVDRLEPGNARSLLGFVGDAIRLVGQQDGDGLAVLGFTGAPYTIASYMVEGGSSKHFEASRGMMHGRPELFERLLDKIASVAADYVELQIEAGADAIQIFDTWAGELAPADFRRFALPPVCRIVDRARRLGVPVIYYVNGIGNLLEAAKESGASVLGIDWRVELSEVRRRLGHGQAVQGNLEPAALLGSAESIRERVRSMLDQTGGLGHIVNLGHGILPDTPLHAIEAFVGAVRTWAQERSCNSNLSIPA